MFGHFPLKEHQPTLDSTVSTMPTDGAFVSCVDGLGLRGRSCIYGRGDDHTADQARVSERHFCPQSDTGNFRWRYPIVGCRSMMAG